MRRPTRIPLACAIVALALAGAGCSSKEPVITEAPTEGVWLDVGALDYHIQGSRQLNGAQVPDDSYLMGLPTGILPPGAKETWFAVFVRVENRTDQAHPTAKDFEIVDTEENVFKPLELRTDANPFAYAPQTLPPEGTIPKQDSAQDFSSASGGLLLFKLPLTSYQNRPLELKITAPPDPNVDSSVIAPAAATVDLDV